MDEMDSSHRRIALCFNFILCFHQSRNFPALIAVNSIIASLTKSIFFRGSNNCLMLIGQNLIWLGSSRIKSKSVSYKENSYKEDQKKFFHYLMRSK